jgi:hypothetical protein
MLLANNNLVEIGLAKEERPTKATLGQLGYVQIQVHPGILPIQALNLLWGAERGNGSVHTARNISRGLRVRIPFLEQKGDNCGVRLDMRIINQDGEAEKLPSTYSSLHSSSRSKGIAAFRELGPPQNVGKCLPCHKNTRTPRKENLNDRVCSSFLHCYAPPKIISHPNPTGIRIKIRDSHRLVLVLFLPRPCMAATLGFVSELDIILGHLQSNVSFLPGLFLSGMTRYGSTNGIEPRETYRCDK